MVENEAIPIAVAVVQHQGRVLIGQRPRGTPLAGRWEFPGGKVRADETPADAAIRECLEETGMAIRLGSPYPMVTHRYEHGLVRLDFFPAEPVDPSQLPTNGFRWVRVDDLPAYPFPAANAAVLEQLRRRR